MHLSICFLVFWGGKSIQIELMAKLILLWRMPQHPSPLPSSLLSLSWLHFIPFSVLLSFNNYKSSLMALLSCLPAVFAKNIMSSSSVGKYSCIEVHSYVRVVDAFPLKSRWELFVWARDVRLCLSRSHDVMSNLSTVIRYRAAFDVVWIPDTQNCYVAMRLSHICFLSSR